MTMIEQEIRKTIENFELRLLHKLRKMTISNGQELCIALDFEFVDRKVLSVVSYAIGLIFRNVRVERNRGLDLLDVLDFDTITIDDISPDQWEQMHWCVKNVDDDGEASFAFYCQELGLEYIERIEG